MGTRMLRMRFDHGGGLLLLILAIGAAGLGGRALPASAQGSNNPVELQETTIYGMGARAMGMGMAYTAVSEDASAILFNPAGLSQIRRIEFSTGLAYDHTKDTIIHYRTSETPYSKTSLDHVAFAYPVPTYRGSLVLAFGFNRVAPLATELYQEGFALPVTTDSPGLFLVEDYQREGMLNAWTGAAAIDLSPNLSVGVSVSYLSGSSTESLDLAQYRVTSSSLDLGFPDDPEDWPFRYQVNQDESASGYTGSLGILGHVGNTTRLGAVVELPKKITYDGNSSVYMENKEYPRDLLYRDVFSDKITLPLSVSGGLSWGTRGLLLAASARWTDYSQIDYAGRLELVPMVQDSLTLQPKPVYRSVVAVNLGAEYQFTNVPLRLRAGFFTEPIPYKLIAADPDYVFQPGSLDSSYVYRDYPQADIVSDRKFFTVGAGFLVENSLTLDVAYLRGTWERQTPSDYQNTTTYFPTVRTREKVSQDRVFVSTTFHFE